MKVLLQNHDHHSPTLKFIIAHKYEIHIPTIVHVYIYQILVIWLIDNLVHQVVSHHCTQGQKGLVSRYQLLIFYLMTYRWQSSF